MKDLDWDGLETITTDSFYDICNGYYNDEVKDENTRKKLIEAIRVINSLKRALCEKDLIG